MKTLFALLLLCPTAVAQVFPAPLDFVPVLHAPPGGAGSLWVYETEQGMSVWRPAWASDLALLSIDFVGRTAVDELAPDRPRLRQELNGPARLELPAQRGELYRYRRTSAGTSMFGFLWIQPDGRPQRRLELAGSGGTLDPFVARIAVDSAGRTLLVATTFAAGGNLLEVDLASGKVLDRTPNEAPLAFSDAGLWLAPEWGFAVAAEGVWRFARSNTKPAARVSFPLDADPAYYTGQAAMSPARTVAIITAGAGPQSLYAYVFGMVGTAQRATKTAAPLAGAGYLPEAGHGPYLAVADDARHAAWRTQVSPVDTAEAHLAPVLATPQDGVQVSADAYFLDTLDEIGQMDFRFGPRTLTLAVGSRSATTGAIENIDFFTVELDAGGNPQFQNITKSSGDNNAPFQTPGTITPETAHRLPGGAGTLIYDSDNERLFAVKANHTVVTLLNAVKEIQVVEPAGASLFLGLRRESGNKPGEAYSLPLDLSGPLASLPGGGDDIEFLHAASDGVRYVSVVRTDDVAESLLRIDLATAQLETWPGTGPFPGPLGHDRKGSLLFTAGVPSGSVTKIVWPTTRPPFTLQAPSGPATIVR